MSDTPNPGSPAAVEAGCTCPIANREIGATSAFRVPEWYVIFSTCPIHGFDDGAAKEEVQE
jgi:hypothetical protein